ncbi:acyltransferase [Chloroflexus sp.]|uniref:acyltransferase n=1 Tax=Chloroflexus sp. TaxID=1904827 RepID=UPI00404A9783
MPSRRPTDIASDILAVLRARWYLRSATLGPRVRLWGRPAISNHGQLIIGERARLVSTIVPLELAVAHGARLEIGQGAFINYGCSIAATELVRIGPRCNIGTYAMIMDNDFHRLEPERRQERPPSAPIILEENVWLGGRVTVLSGVTIGTGSVVGAGSVVTKSIPPRSLAAGVPARVIRQL